jgi:glycosyltransferase involved in cell wall biosynthesis
MISILLPIYNGERFLKKTIDSVLNQTFKNYELLIGFNGTADSSISIVDSYNDDRIRVFNYGNDTGKAKTLNKLLKISNYDLIALQDDDDIWINNKLETQIKYINDYDVVGTQMLYIDEYDNIISGNPILQTQDNMIKNLTLRGNNQIANSSTLIKKNSLIDCGGWDESLTALEDFDLWIRMIIKGKKIMNINEYLFLHRKHKYSNFNTLPTFKHDEIMFGIFKKNGFN